MLDAGRDAFDVALAISKDSDLVTPIRLVIEEFGTAVGVSMPILNLNPDGSARVPSNEIRKVSTFQRYIKDTAAGGSA